jgi:hypothetical protein
MPTTVRGIFYPEFPAGFQPVNQQREKTSRQKETRHEAGFQRTGIELLQAGA